MAVVLLALCDMLCGGAALSPGEVISGLGQGSIYSDIVLGLRLPRMLTAMLAGAALSLSGAQMQAIFRNPLADPHIMGVSSGAGLGAALCIIATHGSAAPVVVSAFAGAIVSSLLILSASSRLRSTYTLLVFGVMLGFIFSAVTSTLEYTANEESLKLFYSWAAGTFTGSGYTGVTICAAALTIGFALSMINAKGLDIILFGDDYAALSGASVRGIRTLCILGSSLMTAAVTAFCGPLGFVGIAAPHIFRAIAGTSVHRNVLPGSLLTGAALSLGADIISQNLPVPLPAGPMLALLGIPVILFIMLGGRKA